MVCFLFPHALKLHERGAILPQAQSPGLWPWGPHAKEAAALCLGSLTHTWGKGADGGALLGPSPRDGGPVSQCGTWSGCSLPERTGVREGAAELIMHQSSAVTFPEKGTRMQSDSRLQPWTQSSKQGQAAGQGQCRWVSRSRDTGVVRHPGSRLGSALGTRGSHSRVPHRRET